MKEVTIKNVGPIESLIIPIPDDGGVVVLRGRNGAGKSTALDATAKLLKRKGQLGCRDGSLKGSVEGMGARITVGRATTRAGELVAVHLEDRFAIAELVDPGIKDPALADARRIRSLVALSGVTPDLEAFREVLGDAAINVASEETGGASDVLEMATKIKQACQKAARALETTAEQQAGEARGLRESVADVPIDVELPSMEDARETVLAAIHRKGEIQERYRTSLQLDASRREAMASLESIEAEYSGPTVEQAQDEINDIGDRWRDAKEAVEAAKAAEREAARSYSTAEQALLAAQQHAQTVSACREAIDAASAAEPVDESELADADANVDKAQSQLELVGRVNEAKAKLRRAQERAETSKKAAANAAEYRDAANATDEVLARMIPSGQLTVLDGRLVVATPRGKTYYSDLSPGERWAIALEIAAQSVGDSGLIVVPQNAWEGLDAANRAAIASEARQRCVTILTAEAQRDGEPADLVATAAEDTEQ